MALTKVGDELEGEVEVLDGGDERLNNMLSGGDTQHHGMSSMRIDAEGAERHNTEEPSLDK